MTRANFATYGVAGQAPRAETLHRQRVVEPGWTGGVSAPLQDTPAEAPRGRAPALPARLGQHPSDWTVDPGEPTAWPARTVIAFAEQRGISRRTLHEAKKLCQVEDQREGFGPGSEIWWLPPRRVFVRWVPGHNLLEHLRDLRDQRKQKRSSPP